MEGTLVHGTAALAVEYGLGLVCVIVGLSLLLQRAVWREWIAGVAAGGARKALTVGLLELSFFSLMLGAHWIWSGPGLFVTLLCVIGVLEGALYLLKPQLFPPLVASLMIRDKGLLKYSGIFSIIIGLLVLCIWYDRLTFGEWL